VWASRAERLWGVWRAKAGAIGASKESRSPLHAYDPLAVGSVESSIELAARDTIHSRDLPLRVYLPATPGPAPIVLFSHGLGGNRNGGAFLGKHWSARGYVAVFLRHPGMR